MKTCVTFILHSTPPLFSMSPEASITPSCLVAREFYCLKFWEEMERCTSLHNANMIWNQSKWTEYILVPDVRIIFSSKKRKYPLLVFTDWLVLAAGLVLDSITITVNPSTTWCARTHHTPTPGCPRTGDIHLFLFLWEEKLTSDRWLKFLDDIYSVFCGNVVSSSTRTNVCCLVWSNSISILFVMCVCVFQMEDKENGELCSFWEEINLN